MLAFLKQKFLALILHLNKYPVLYSGKRFYLVGFGLFAALATFFGGGALITFAHAKGIHFEFPLLSWILIMVCIMLFCSRMLHPFVVGKDFFQAPAKHLRQATFYNQGGQIGVLLSIALISYYEEINFLTLADAICYGFCLALVLGRLGCYNYGCCFGKETRSKFAVSYTHPQSKVLRLRPELNNVPLVPTQLISAGFDLLLFVGLTLLFYLEPKDGVIAIAFIVAYNIFRSATHRLRANDTKINQGDDCDIFLLLSALFTSIGTISILMAIYFYEHLPETAIQIPLSFNLYLQHTFLNLNNFSALLFISLLVFFAYGYHHLKLGEHF